jgi:hypothetical protein
LRHILNAGRVDLPTDVLAALFSRGFLTQEAYNAGRVFAALVRIARAGWGLSDTGVAHLWRMVQLGEMAEQPGPIVTNGHDAGGAYAEYARRRLAEMRSELQRRGENERILTTVMVVCVDNRWEGWVKRILTKLRELPSDWRSLGDLREGLGRLAEFHGGRRRDVSSRAAAAE